MTKFVSSEEDFETLRIFLNFVFDNFSVPSPDLKKFLDFNLPSRYRDSGAPMMHVIKHYNKKMQRFSEAASWDFDGSSERRKTNPLVL